MAKKEKWVPPEDPDFAALALAGYEAWLTDKPELVAFDCETHGTEFHDLPFCFQFSWDGIYGKEAHYFEMEKYDATRYIREILTGSPRLMGHNIKFDLQKAILVGLLDRDDVRSYRIEDTEALAHLTDEHRKKGLKKLAISVLGIDDVVEVETKSGVNKGVIRKIPREKYELDAVRRNLKKKKEDGYGIIPRAILMPYAVKDALFTSQLYDELFPEVSKHDDLHRLYRQEMTLTLVFLDMENCGLGVDIPYVKKMAAEYQNKVLATENRIEAIVGRPVGKAKAEFNPNSNPKIREYFEGKGEVHDKYDENVLSTLSDPLAVELLNLRSDQKILGTYLLALIKGSHLENGKWVFHPSIRQHGTVTGRTSSGGAQEDG